MVKYNLPSYSYTNSKNETISFHKFDVKGKPTLCFETPVGNFLFHFIIDTKMKKLPHIYMYYPEMPEEMYTDIFDGSILDVFYNYHIYKQYSDEFVGLHMERPTKEHLLDLLLKEDIVNFTNILVYNDLGYQYTAYLNPDLYNLVLFVKDHKDEVKKEFSMIPDRRREFDEKTSSYQKGSRKP
jgi:hypothetical protein